MTRKVDSSGNVCFAAVAYRVGSKFRRRQVQVAVVGDRVEISIGEQLIRRHKIKHDRTREHGALAKPRRPTTPDQRRLNPTPTCQPATEVTTSSGCRSLDTCSRGRRVGEARLPVRGENVGIVVDRLPAKLVEIN